MVLARAITLIESNLPADGELAARLLDALLPHTGKSLRVGITGVPGVGKSTFIDALGMHLIRRVRRERGGAERRSVEPDLRRQHSRRQDPHGAAGGGASAPSSGPRRRAVIWAAWRGARAKPSCCARRRAIEHPGRDRRRGAVRNRGPVDDGFLPAADAGRRRRRIAGHEARHHRDARRHGHQQGRRRQQARRPSGRASSTRARCTCFPPRPTAGRRAC